MSSPTAFAGQKPTTARARSSRSRDDPVEQGDGVRVERPRLGADDRVVEDGRVAALQFPRLEERRPVDPLDEVLQRDLVNARAPVKAGTGTGTERSARSAFARASASVARASAVRRPRARAGPSRIRPRSDRGERVPPLPEERGDDAHGPRRVGDVDDDSGYSGAIRTAVWTRESSRPPISSGMVNPSRVISPATWRISSSDG